MPAVPISMRKLKEILRLKYGLGLSHRLIARSLVISPSVVSRYANRAAQLGIKHWPLPPEWDDATLHRAFLKTRVLGPCPPGLRRPRSTGSHRGEENRRVVSS